MTEYPIIMSAEMVRAILEKRKSQTRRVIKPQPVGIRSDWSQDIEPGHVFVDMVGQVWRAYESRGRWKSASGVLSKRLIIFAQPGDLLWVRETWREAGSIQREDGKIPSIGTPDQVYYYADDKAAFCDGPWRSPIHMPRWASRILLRVTEVRVQRVQEISEEDARAEGVEKLTMDDLGGTWRTYRRGFHAAWDSLNAKRGYGWETKCWVWAISFERGAG